MVTYDEKIKSTNFDIGSMITDKSLFKIWDLVSENKRLGENEGITMFNSNDFLSLGRMANWKTEQISGKNVFYVLNTHINPTNICVLSCKFCDFAKKPKDDGAYELSDEEILNHLKPDIDEVHIVGGHHPTWPFEKYVNLVKMIKQYMPKVQIKAFTAAEIDYFARRWKMPPEESLKILKEAGLASLPGGGAEVFSSRIHKLLYPGKTDEKRWLSIHRIAHNYGIKTNCTLLYGHIETYQERVQHFIKLREQQDETGGFLAFIPLEYQVGTTNLRPRHTPPMDDLKVISVARLMLDNIDYIKSYWVMLGITTASVGLNFGANDLDGTIQVEKIAHAALSDSPIGRTEEALLMSIRDAGKIPVRRDALYNLINS